MLQTRGMDYTLHHGDCLEVMAGMEAGSVDAIVTDPPFAFAGGLSNGQTSVADDQFFRFWWKEVCRHLERVLKPTGEGFIWCDWRTATAFADGFCVPQKYTWRAAQMLYHYREMPGMGTPFRSSVDMILYVRGPKARSSRIPNTTHNFISRYWYYGKHDNHPAEKDTSIAATLLGWCSDPGDTVLDPFTGSGTTGVACAKEGRDFIGIEREAEYVEIARRRIEAAAAQLTLL
jgi:site-specific DNA-methyltransferase (adenine-specific)